MLTIDYIIRYYFFFLIELEFSYRISVEIRFRIIEIYHICLSCKLIFLFDQILTIIIHFVVFLKE